MTSQSVGPEASPHRPRARLRDALQRPPTEPAGRIHTYYMLLVLTIPAALGELYEDFRCHDQGCVNRALVEDTHWLFVDLSLAFDEHLRYFDVLEPASSEPFDPDTTHVVLAARGGHGHEQPNQETWNMKLVEAEEEAKPRVKLVIYDRGFAANAFMRKMNGAIYAFGGEYIDVSEQEWEWNDPRDGVHVVSSPDLSAVRQGVMMHPPHGYRLETGSWQQKVDRRHGFVFDGLHEGHADARGGQAGFMMFDGKLSAVWWRGRFLVYARANLKQYGGRFVVVARSRGPEAFGEDAYEPFERIRIDGYDTEGWGTLETSMASLAAFMRGRGGEFVLEERVLDLLTECTKHRRFERAEQTESDWGAKWVYRIGWSWAPERAFSCTC